MGGPGSGRKRKVGRPRGSSVAKPRGRPRSVGRPTQKALYDRRRYKAEK